MLICDRGWLRAHMQQGLAILAINVCDLSSMRAAIKAAAEVQAPLLLAIGERYLSQAPLDAMAALARALDKEHSFPLGLHLDHARSLDTVRAALDAGFTSVMFDGSALPWHENIGRTAEAVRMAGAYGAAVEGELGGLNDEHGGGACGPLTDPGQASEFAAQTGVDLLAVSVGNRHGLYENEPRLELDLVGEIAVRTRCPLALHGCSGIPLPQLRQGAALGIRKFNLNTEIAMAGAKMAIASGAKRMDSLLAAAEEGMRIAAVPYFIMLSGKEADPDV